MSNASWAIQTYEKSLIFYKEAACQFKTLTGLPVELSTSPVSFSLALVNKLFWFPQFQLNSNSFFWSFFWESIFFLQISCNLNEPHKWQLFNRRIVFSNWKFFNLKAEWLSMVSFQCQKKVRENATADSAIDWRSVWWDSEDQPQKISEKRLATFDCKFICPFFGMLINRCPNLIAKLS